MRRLASSVGARERLEMLAAAAAPPVSVPERAVLVTVQVAPPAVVELVTPSGQAGT
jgi:hypothetical protein